MTGQSAIKNYEIRGRSIVKFQIVCLAEVSNQVSNFMLKVIVRDRIIDKLKQRFFVDAVLKYGYIKDDKHGFYGFSLDFAGVKVQNKGYRWNITGVLLLYRRSLCSF